MLDYHRFQEFLKGEIRRDDKIVDSNNEVVDKADLSKVPIPVTPGYFAIEKEVPKVTSTPETVEKDYTVDFYEIGKIKYRDIKN